MVVVNRTAEEIRKRWSRGESPDLATLLSEHPELKAHRSVFLDLAHDEFCRRVEAGEAVDTDEFCRQFPSFQNSLYMLIEVNRLLRLDPQSPTTDGAPGWPTAGESFLGYSLLSEIGRGAFARVFLASEPALGGRFVVLKIAPHGGGEAEVAGRLRHRNIVPIHSVKEDAATGLSAICMPYLGQATLCDLLDHAFSNGCIPTDTQVIADTFHEVHDDSVAREIHDTDRSLLRGTYVEAIVRIVAQLADALAYTHARGICHRDLKPSNVLLSIEGRPLLLDFNLSADGEWNAWRVGGTLPYMAPEQLHGLVHGIRGQAIPPDPRSDVYSLGVIAYQLLCGALPFGPLPRGSSIEEVAEGLLKQHESGPRPIRGHNRQVDRSLGNLIESCLARCPDDRPPSAEALARSLRRQLTPWRRGRRWAGNHPRWVVAIVATLLAASLAGGAFLALRDPYNVRQLNQGLRYAEQGQYQLAARCLDESLEAEPRSPKALFARGQVRQELGLYDMAAVDFHEAWRIEPKAELHVYQGFCASKLNQHNKARIHYEKALEAGLRQPDLLNNLGHECIRLNRLDDAERYLNEALEADPDLQAAHNNLVLLHVHRSAAGGPVTESVLVHAERAAKSGQPSGEFFYYVGTLFGRAGKQAPQWVQPAKKYLCLAIAHHMSPRAILSDRDLSYLLQDPQIQALCNQPTSREPVLKPLLIVDPVATAQGTW